MAQKVQVILVDDIDGGKADETVKFGLDGVTYQIDVSTKNAKKLRDAFAPYVADARRGPGRAAGRKRTTRTGRSRRGGSDAAAVRKWAKANGHKVSDRGRVPASVQAAYRSAH